ncbi:MAG TPA: ABC transporter permease [Pyrinomonadaceae bacterium]|nr:ABC transporter permease [Pyrinomonadaceae bacterium]
MNTLWQDVRYAARVLWKSPGFTLVAVVALALGIGANTAIFSVVHALMLRALPFADSERLVMMWEFNRPREQRQNVVAPANFLDWREQANTFEGMAAFVDGNVNLTGDADPVEIPSQYVTPNLFPLLGVEPLLGRGLTDEDATPDAENVVLLSYATWQSRFGGDPSVVGKTMTLNSEPATIIGVMPADFHWFIKKSSNTGKPPEVWGPIGFTEQSRVRRGRFLTVVARIRPGITREQAQAEMDALAARYEQDYPDFNKGWGVELVPLREQFTGEIGRALWVLLGAVGFLLLIACANVANLLLARAASRRREIAIRTAVGASRWRIVRQLLTESVLLAVVGGGLGLLLAWWGVEVLVALSPRNLADFKDVSLNLPVLLFTFGVSILTGIIFGLAPAFESTRLNTNEALKEGGKGMTGGRGSRRLRGAFVVAEVALALMLLVGAGLMARSFMRLQSVDPGFRAENVLTMRLTLPASKYREEPKRTAFYKEAVARIGALPGVESAGAVTYLPFSGPGSATRFTVVDRPPPPPEQSMTTDVRLSDANYFRTMGIPLLRGRNFNESEQTEARRVVLISESLARKYFPGEDPLGKSLVINMRATPTPTEIIGIVGDVRHTSLDAEVRPTVYWPHPELPLTVMTVVARTKGDPLALASAAQREVQAIDPQQPVADVRTMEQWLAQSTERARFSALLLVVFSCIALMLAAVGTYGVMNYSVTQRTHEIGVRMALGARGRDVLRMVVGGGMLLTLIGVVLGLGAAFALTRVLESLLYGVTATDPATFGAVAALLLVIGFLACYVPARRAARVDPMVALRYE